MQATKIEHPVDVWQVMEMPYQDEEAIMMEDDIEIPDWVIEALFTDNRMGETDPDELGDFWVSNGEIATSGWYGDYLINDKGTFEVVSSTTFDKKYKVSKEA